MYRYILIMLLAGCFNNIVWSQINEESNFVSKLDKTQLSDLNYYQKFKNDNITLNVCNWGEYLADGSQNSMDVIKEFENLTGIKVNYTLYNSNEDLYSALKLETGNYDVITPTDYIIKRMIENKVVQKLNLDLLPARKNIDPFFLSLAYDKKGEYTIPYTWGMSGIIYNKKNIHLNEDEIEWSILFDDTYYKMILMAITPRDSFTAANAYLGFNLHTTNRNEILKSFDALKRQKSIVKDYVMEEILYQIKDEEAILGITYGGDALNIIEQNTNINFVIPKVGGNPFVECMLIPANSQNPEAAHMYINFLCEQQAAYENALFTKYATANTAALELLPEEIKNNKKVYPDKEKLLSMTEHISNLDHNTGILMEALWANLMESNDKSFSFNKLFIHIIIITVIILIIIELKKIRKNIKNNLEHNSISPNRRRFRKSNL